MASGCTKAAPPERQKPPPPPPPLPGKEAASTTEEDEETGRERLKRHRVEMAGRVWIPDIWGQEGFLKDWVDCSAFDSSLVPSGVVTAREALVGECRRTTAAAATRSGARIRIGDRC